jgi:formylglycine-generating enzyme required for sulfatase activity
MGLPHIPCAARAGQPLAPCPGVPVRWQTANRVGRFLSLFGSKGLKAFSLTAMWLGLVLLGTCARAPTPTPASRPAPIYYRDTDGAQMMLVPAGEFLMGSTDGDPKAGGDEMPQHTVYLDAFYIDRVEVTNARYVQFLNTLGGHTGKCGGRDCAETQIEDKYSHILHGQGHYMVESGFEEHPATQVSWYGAQAYCAWAGARLPTEAEWEKAARGVDGRLYPWGSEPPDCDKAQYGDCGGATVPVGNGLAGASPYGAMDMAGNVWEWVNDWYDPDYYSSSPARNPQGPDSGVRKVFRGGSWGYLQAFIRTGDRARNRPAYAGFNVGFRCAARVPPE